MIGILKSNKINFFHFLCNKGARTEIVNKTDETVLLYAIKRYTNIKDIVQIIIPRCNSDTFKYTDLKGNTALMYSIITHRESAIIKTLLNKCEKETINHLNNKSEDILYLICKDNYYSLKFKYYINLFVDAGLIINIGTLTNLIKDSTIKTEIIEFILFVISGVLTYSVFFATDFNGLMFCTFIKL